MSTPPTDATAGNPNPPAPRVESNRQKNFSRAARTPYPAWIFSGSLLTTAFFNSSLTKRVPSPFSCYGFAAASAIGGYMIFDGAVNDGAGFTSAWSVLYLLVNARPSIKSLRPVPIALTGLAAYNTLLYGNKYLLND